MGWWTCPHVPGSPDRAVLAFPKQPSLLPWPASIPRARHGLCLPAMGLCQSQSLCLGLDLCSYPVSHSYKSWCVPPGSSSSVSAPFPTQSGLLGGRLPKAQHQQPCSLSGPVDLGCAGMGREELTALPLAGMLQGARPALFLDRLQTQPCSSASLAFLVGWACSAGVALQRPVLLCWHP